jgi:hypothetical protein
VIESLPRGYRELELGSKSNLQERCMRPTNEGGGKKTADRIILRISAGEQSYPAEKTQGGHVGDTWQRSGICSHFGRFNHGRDE